MNFNITSTIKKENFILISKNYKNSLKTKNYKNSKITFKNYITTIEKFCTYKIKFQNHTKKEKRKYINFMNDYENLIKLKKSKIFENLDFEKKNFCKSFPYLTFFLYNVLTKIWLNEKIFENDVENLSGKDKPFFLRLVKMKFDIHINIAEKKLFLEDLNNLKNLKIEKRNEEYIKFLGRDFLKFLNKIFSSKILMKILITKIGKKKFDFFFFVKKNKIFLKKFC